MESVRCEFKYSRAAVLLVHLPSWLVPAAPRVGRVMSGVPMIIVRAAEVRRQYGQYPRAIPSRLCEVHVAMKILYKPFGIVLGILPILGLLLRPGFHITQSTLIFRDDRRCLHDQLAGTKVLKA